MKKQKEPEPEKISQIAIKLIDSVYLFNPILFITSIYTLRENGFSFTVTKYEEAEFIKYSEFIKLNKGSKEINEVEFNDFVNKIDVLQTQANALKPLVPFDKYIEIIKQTHSLFPKK